MALRPRQFFEQLLANMLEPNREALVKLVHPEFVGYFPQTGEIGRGFESFWTGVSEYPGGAPDTEIPSMRLLGDEERWAISPGYTVVPLADPTRFTVVGNALYPDGVRWHIVMSVELRDGQLYRSETYFAPEMPAPLAQSMAAFGGEIGNG
jgi:hypothetical protein